MFKTFVPQRGDSRTDPVAKLIFEIGKLPGIGEKTATRLAYFILKQDPSYAASLSEAIQNAKKSTLICDRCQTFTDSAVCRICENASRSTTEVCVVERPSDILSIENSGSFRGTYHVLHGVLSPLDGVGPEDLKIQELLKRLQPTAESHAIREVILATNPSVEGEATSLYLAKLIRPLGIRVTKLASGIPMGGRLEFSDRQTISKALENRMELGGAPA